MSTNGEPERTSTPTTKDQPSNAHDIQTVVISQKKPASFEGVEMVTYHSEFGYEVTYPAKWLANDVTNVYGNNNALNAYEIRPLASDDRYLDDQIAVIAVENRTLNDLVGEIRSGKNIFVDKDTELLPVTINGVNGLYVPLRYLSARYYFEKKNNLYSVVLLYDPMMNISQEEAMWVLSTFKITE